MKVKLLKKIRERFKWSFNYNGIITVYDRTKTRPLIIKPPIEIDFCVNYRWLVTDWTLAKYLADHVCDDAISDNYQKNYRIKNMKFRKKHFNG